MKLKEWIKQLEEFVKENPEALEYDAYTSMDDEGNGYNAVYYSPSIAEYDHGDIITKENYDEEPEYYEDGFHPNAVLLS